jgi:septum formation protein
VSRRAAQPQLVLASGSPRRQKLLHAAGYDFKVVGSNLEERFEPELSVGELTLWNAMHKGFSVARAYPEAVVLAADTLVSLSGRIMGKPRDMAEALTMLRQLNGRVHQVCTGVFVGRRSESAFSVFREISHVTFRKLDQAGLRRYLSLVNPLDKAGAYAAQENGEEIIAGIDGSRSNVIGLPLEQTAAALRAFEIEACRRA